MSKSEEMAVLVAKRKATQWPGYKGIGDYHDGVYECDHVSPLSKAAGNLDSPVMLLAQDWDSDDGLTRPPKDPSLGYDPDLATNKNLDALLLAHFQRSRRCVFATNLFPLVKPGDMSAPIPRKHLVQAAHEFAIPQILIVKPRLVVCFGLATFNALLVATGGKAVGRIAEAIATPFTYKDGHRIWCQSHPGALGRNNRNRGQVDRVTGDWAAMAAVLS